MKPTILKQKLICLTYHVKDRNTQIEIFSINDVMTVPARWTHGMIRSRVNDIIYNFEKVTPNRNLTCDIIG